MLWLMRSAKDDITGEHGEATDIQGCPLLYFAYNSLMVYIYTFIGLIDVCILNVSHNSRPVSLRSGEVFETC